MGQKGNKLGLDVKKMMVKLLPSGYSWRKASEMLKLPKSTVTDVCKNFLNREGNNNGQEETCNILDESKTMKDHDERVTI
jgi:transposase